MKTYSPKPRDIERRWYVIDAQGAVLGRLASEVAKLLRGKHKPIFAPHADTGDHVIVVNARGVRLTGNKEQAKVFYRHSGYPGGLRRIGYARLMAERPSLAVEKAIRGMLPKTRLGRQMIKKLAVYDGATHPHKAQRPESLELGRLPKWEGLPKPSIAPAAPKSPRPSRRDRPDGAGETSAPTGGRSAGAGSSRRVKPRTAPAKARASVARRTASAGAGAKTSPRARSSAPARAKAKRATRAATTETEKKPPRSRRRKSTTKES